ncbi:ywrD [Symbiodinium microadriaticum]|nr:ywrD [Symbiodinium microadriaticum]
MAGQEDLPSLSALCVTVPGAAAAWESAVQRWGKLSLRQVLSPAIELATEGFPVAPGAAYLWRESEGLLRRAARGKDTPFLPGGRAPVAGEIFKNPDLASTFQRVSDEGASKGFYQGPVAESIVQALSERGEVCVGGFLGFGVSGVLKRTKS